MKFVFFSCFIVGVAFSAHLVDRLETNAAEEERLLQDEETAEADESLGKRAIYQLADMIKCTTGRSIWKYAFYGCWCGKGGKGSPVDATDSCCKTHDECYTSLKDAGTCGHFQLYFENYDYSTSDCQTANATITCTGGTGNTTTCADELCLCDKALAECLGASPFDRNFKHYPKFLC